MTPIHRDFSPRERQIVAALLEAKQVKDIALDLDLSVNTVKDYLKTIYRKAQVHSARELMRQVSLQGLPALPGLPPAPPPRALPDAALAQLLRCSQRLGDEGSPREMLAHLAEAVRRCTRARRVSFWRWVRHGGEMALAQEGGGGAGELALLRAPGFLGRLRQQGWARLEAAEMASDEGLQFSQHGLTGEVVGAVCAPAPRVQVVLAGGASDGRLGALDAATLRLLARLVQSNLDQAPLVMRASA